MDAPHAYPIENTTGVEIGVVPTHIKFIGGLVPGEGGRLPRDGEQLAVLKEMEKLKRMSPTKIDIVPVPAFPGMHKGDTDELLNGLKEMGFKPQLILMVGGDNADPMNPEHEDNVVAMLRSGIAIAKEHGIEEVASTSIEQWMQPGAKPKKNDDFDAAVQQVAKLHSRVYREENLGESPIKAWHIEFLRPGEMQTFTNLYNGWIAVQEMNNELVDPTTFDGPAFFKVLIDAAHCGDSGEDLTENEKTIAEIAESDEFSMFHASAKTTRGHFSTDDGWIGALLTAAAKTGKLKSVMVELFHHEDPALEGLRQLDPGHGIDTTLDGNYSSAVVDGVKDVVARLLNLEKRGFLPKK